MIKKVEGIIIRETNYRETSKIINIFTFDYGIIGVLCKGARRMKSPFSSCTGKLIYGNFHLNYKENGLSSLVDVDVIDSFKMIRKNITKISYATFITDLTEQVYKHENNTFIYELYKQSLIKIDEGYDAQVITNILELKLLDYLGIRPVIDKCVCCGKVNDIVTISSYKGGYICKNCLSNEKIVSLKTIKLIRMLYYVDIALITKTEISEMVKRELNAFIDEYYDRYTGLYLKSKAFLNNLSKI